MTTATDTTTRACDDCRTLAPYEPAMLFGNDMLAMLPHYCHDCGQKRQQAANAIDEAERIEAMRATWEATVPATYRNTDIDHADFPRSTYLRIREVLNGRGLALIGKPGKCKTRILALLAKRAIYAGQSIGWVRTHQLEDNRLMRSNYKRAEEARNEARVWKTAKVLILDDLGKSPWSPAFEAVLFDLMEFRYSTGRVTHWSLNPLPEDTGNPITRETIADALDPTGAAAKRPSFGPILDRLHHETLIVPIY
jgi:DNA replication protein DnaC